jgi:hypothetical protein
MVQYFRTYMREVGTEGLPIGSSACKLLVTQQSKADRPF